MLDTDQAQLVTCKFLGNRFVIHDLRLNLEDASLLKKSLENTFDWIHDLWIDNDAPDQTTVKFGATHGPGRMTDGRRIYRIRLMVEHTLEHIGWDIKKTQFVFDEF